MRKQLKWIYHYAVHVPHSEVDWKLAFTLSVAMGVAIVMNF